MSALLLAHKDLQLLLSMRHLSGQAASTCSLDGIFFSLLTLPTLLRRGWGFWVQRLAVRRQVYTNRPRGQISPSVSSGMPYRTEC